MSRYDLQVKIPYQAGTSDAYIPGSGYWNTVDSTPDLEYLKSQAEIMREFWKHVRIVQKREVVIEEMVVDE